MGTRCLTVFKDGEKEIAVLYRQFDGYLDGHGKSLAEFCSGIKIVNGLGVDIEKMANGMGCLSAQIVAHFKQKCGGFYLYASGTRDVWEDYIYIVSGEVGEEPKISVQTFGKVIFEGFASELVKRIEDGDLEQDEDE